MAQTKSGAERARRHRNRKRCGTVFVQFELKRAGVEALVAGGLLDDEASADPAEVREALIKLNETLVPPQPAQPLRQALRSVTFGLL